MSVMTVAAFIGSGCSRLEHLVVTCPEFVESDTLHFFRGFVGKSEIEGKLLVGGHGERHLGVPTAGKRSVRVGLDPD